jgi:hypothetical protein
MKWFLAQGEENTMGCFFTAGEAVGLFTWILSIHFSQNFTQ